MSDAVSLSYEASGAVEAPELPYQPEQSVSTGPETVDEWMRPLYDLVVANATEVRKWSWMGGAEAPLSTSMWSHPVPTPDNLQQVMSDISQSLANPLKDPEQPKEEDKPQQEEAAQTEETEAIADNIAEDQEEQTKTKTGDERSQNQTEIDEAKHPEPAALAAEASVELGAGAAEPEMVANFFDSASEQSAQTLPQTKVSSASPNGSKAPTRAESPGAPKVIATRSSKSLNPVPESVVEAKHPVPTRKTPKAGVVAKPINEAKPAMNNLQLGTDKQTKSQALPVAIETPTEARPTELSPADLEGVANPDDIAELFNEKFGSVEDKQVLVPLDYEMVSISLDDLNEGEILLNHGVEIVPGPVEPYVLANVPELEAFEDIPRAGEEVIVESEEVVAASLVLEEIEYSLMQLAEGVNDGEIETLGTANEILDKIIEVSEKLEMPSVEDIVSEAQVQEELEELFIELFDRMGIGYTPQLVESLARLTLRQHLVDGIHKLKNEGETVAALQDRGTHEMIKKPLVGLNNIKKTMIHVDVIGKSALQLYSFNFAN